MCVLTPSALADAQECGHNDGMIEDSNTPSATTRSYEEKYQAFVSEEASDARMEALGSDLPNGYTTMGQAERICDALALGPGDWLLDLGAGRGWPGSFIAERSGCRLIATDLPLLALRPAREALRRTLGARASVVCADGRRLPLADGAFDAVCHADVLC
jgi:protein-L-isoaspartate O-methyltransferase